MRNERSPYGFHQNPGKANTHCLHVFSSSVSLGHTGFILKFPFNAGSGIEILDESEVSTCLSGPGMMFRLTDAQVNLVKLSLGMISAFVPRLTSILSGMLLSIVFCAQMADHHTKVKVENLLLRNRQAPKTGSHTNVNQMWVSYSSTTTTGLLFSGNDLVNGAF